MKMIDDAKLKRSLQQHCAEFSKEFDEEHHVKIIGGHIDTKQ